MKTNIMNWKLWILATILVGVESFAGLSLMPVQDGGRIKPFSTFARESLHLVYGRETFKGFRAEDIILSWMFMPEEIDKTPWVNVQSADLKKALLLDVMKTHFAPLDLINNDRMGILISELRGLKDNKEKINPFFQSVQTLENQLSVYHGLRTGLLLRLWPVVDERGQQMSGLAGAWKSPGELPEDAKVKFQNIARGFVEYFTLMVKVAKTDGAKGKDSDEVKMARSKLDMAADQFVDYTNSVVPDYGHIKKIKIEDLYNETQPFRLAWIFYLLGLIFWSVAFFGERPMYTKIAWVALGLGFLAHTLGFAIRVYLLDRPPVSNMFETVIWVAWVNLLFAAFLYWRKNHKIIMVGASMVATFSMILSDVSASVLDPTLSPLEAVLRDNFWLVTHVIIIVSSYGAYFLAFFIGDIVLYYILRDEQKYAKQISDGVLAIYRSIQIGTLLLVAGTILGGVWAADSWGRFWGWDPKETWAFIAFIGYAAVLHARIAGMLKNFGMAASAIVAFSLVIMAWYGVNFVLGAGLHSYGFGAGGVEWVTGFVVLHLVYVAYVFIVRKMRNN
jgi:ABC-type transport system involved in cytochrome c biogenesis permease subunit